MEIWSVLLFQFIDIVNLILKIFVTEKYGIFLAIYGNRYLILSGELKSARKLCTDIL